jgi:protein-S-isoprenylcysteine O-methyltransferase Ste14/prolipoprotein diacylglyceryltransferase
MTMLVTGSVAHVPGAVRTLARTSVIVLAYFVGFFLFLPALLFAFGLRLDRLCALSPVAPPLWISTSLFASGSSLLVGSMLTLALAGRGWPISHLPPTWLVTRGPYAWMRHPIYVGYALMLVGAGLWFGSAGVAWGAGALLWGGWLTYATAFEEPRLAERYGAAFEAYRRRVPLVPLAPAASRGFARLWSALSPLFDALAARTVLFELGPTRWVTFGLFAAFGATLALVDAYLGLVRLVPARIALWFVLTAPPAVILGSRVLALLYELRLLVANRRAALGRVGFVSWGGYVGLAACAVACAGSSGLPALAWLDRVFIAALLCSASGRIGCLTYGCCYGKSHPRGVLFANPVCKAVRETGRAARRVPAQLLSSVLALVIFAVANVAVSHSAPGLTLLLGFLAYSLGRFNIERQREEVRFGAFGLTRGQVACAVVFTLALALFFALPSARAPLAQNPGKDWLAALVVAVPGGLMTFVVTGMHGRDIGRWWS